jgi:hypothetical protein
MVDPLPSAEQPKNMWLAPFIWVSVVISAFGFLSLGSAIHAITHPMKKEDYVAPESALAEAMGIGYIIVGGLVLVSLGALVALIVRLAKKPLTRVDRWVIQIQGAAFILVFAAVAVARLVRGR